MLTNFIHLYLKFFVIFTPFFVLSSFIAMTKTFDEKKKHQIAIKVTISITIASFFLYLFGKYIFQLFGITIDAFRIGAGAVLFLSGLSMLQGEDNKQEAASDQDIAVVPLAIPITVGPGVIGLLLVMGSETVGLTDRLVVMGALLVATISVGVLLMLAGKVKRLIGKQGLEILPKITGLFVAAIAAQIMLTGLKNFLFT